MMKKIAAAAAVVVMGTALTGCQAKETYTKYVKAVMDSTYRNEHTEYLKQVDTTKEDAEKAYEEGVDYMTEAIYTYYEVYPEYISEETAAGYEELARKLFEKTKYTVNDAVKEGKTYKVPVIIEPINFWEASEDDMLDYYVEYWENADESASDEELEEGYAVGLLEILNGYADNMGYKAPITRNVEIIFDSDGKYGVSEAEWTTITEYLLDFTYIME